MSGIAGIFSLDGRPVAESDLWQMASLLHRRAPDGSNIWANGVVGLAQALLITTPEARHEQLPTVSRHGDLVIVADARLDNRPELLATLSLPDQDPRTLGDSVLIIEAYRKWGEACPEKLLGDFAFVIWDNRQQTLFCARDCFGVRPFYYYHDPGRLFAFASEPRAILTLPQIPYRLNDNRIADYLLSLEYHDKTSSFFAEIFRLPPAHFLTITSAARRQRQYWSLEISDDLQLPSNQAYEEAFLDLFTAAVSRRLHGDGLVGSMLSGGMDSGAIVAVGRQVMAEKGFGPLPTFSALAPHPETCVESTAILAALTMDGISPHCVTYENWHDLLPELIDLTWQLDEPFDNHMTLPRVIYLLAHRNQTKAVLDGIDSDILLGEGNALARLLRHGHWLTAWRDAQGLEGFWGKGYSARQEIFKAACHAFVPAPVWRLRRSWRSLHTRQSAEKAINESLISPSFAHSIGLAERLSDTVVSASNGILPSSQQERIQGMNLPCLTVGLERYNRVASALAIEPRHPFLDRRLVEFCVRLPDGQKLRQGWHKAILRHAMAGRLPDAVRWRKGKQHLGWAFTTHLMTAMQKQLLFDSQDNNEIYSQYIKKDAVPARGCSVVNTNDPTQTEKLYDAAHLTSWLRRHQKRPSAARTLQTEDVAHTSA